MHPDKVLKYGARLACLSDYANFGKMERKSFIKDDIVKAVVSLPKEENRSPRIEDFWSQISEMCPGVRHKDLFNYDVLIWDSFKVAKYYRAMKAAIESSLILEKNYREGDYELRPVADSLGTSSYNLLDWLKGKQRIPEGLIYTIKKLGSDFTMEQLAVEYKNTLEETGWER